MNLGDKIKIAMAEAGIRTNKELAQKMDCWPHEIGFWINGQRKPKLESIQKLSGVLNKPLEYFLSGVNEFAPLEDTPHPRMETLNEIVSLKEIGAVRCGEFCLLVSETGNIRTRIINRDFLPPKAMRMSLEELQSRYFVFRAEGDSMEPVILEGDTLIVEKIYDNQCTSGEIILFADSDDHAVCKRIVMNADNIVLKSENSDKNRYPDRVFQGQELEDKRILARVVFIGRVPK